MMLACAMIIVAPIGIAPPHGRHKLRHHGKACGARWHKFLLGEVSVFSGAKLMHCRQKSKHDWRIYVPIFQRTFGDKGAQLGVFK
jgi:hypothetical protein